MIGSSGRRCLGTLLVLAVLARAASAHAEPKSEALAQVLFEEGVQLMSEGRFEDACPKLAESHRLDPAGGTLLNLASCLERLGQLASAYAMYNDALSAAIRDGRKERAAMAQEKIAALRPRVSHVVLQVPPGSNVVEIQLDGIVVGKSGWGTPLPVDPGTHTITASAPGATGWSRELAIGASPEQREVELPLRLAIVTAGPVEIVTPPRFVPALEPAPPARSTTGIWLAAGGGVVAAAGLVVGIVAWSKKLESDAACPSSTTCTPDGVRSMHTAEALAWSSNIAIGVGLTAAAVGGVILMSRPRKSIAARVGPGAIVLTGTF